MPYISLQIMLLPILIAGLRKLQQIYEPSFLAWPLACHICFARISAEYLHNIFLSIIFVAAAADASSAVSLQPQNCKAHLRKGYGVEYILYIFIYLFIHYIII